MPTLEIKEDPYTRSTSLIMKFNNVELDYVSKSVRIENISKAVSDAVKAAFIDKHSEEIIKELEELIKDQNVVKEMASKALSELLISMIKEGFKAVKKENT